MFFISWMEEKQERCLAQVSLCFPWGPALKLKHLLKWKNLSKLKGLAEQTPLPIPVNHWTPDMKSTVEPRATWKDELKTLRSESLGSGGGGVPSLHVGGMPVDIQGGESL